MTQQSAQQPTAKRTFTGTVVSDKMNKTILVRVERMIVHPKYGKRYTQSRKYAVHDELNAFKTGDQVLFCESRPRSKTKRWCIVSPPSKE